MAAQPSEELQAFENRNGSRDYTVTVTSPEFTCMCPWTGQPDFATIVCSYIPHEFLVELKSLKLYLWNFRNRGVTHEDAVNEIADEFLRVIKPKFLLVRGEFSVRGGITTSVEVTAGDKKLYRDLSRSK